MCGIFALAQREKLIDVREIKCACSLLRHRGPDQSGYALLNHGTVGFGHNRLSIQDPAAPPQPLVDQSTGTTIIFNGEVYDHIEIGRSLEEGHGITLTEATDTTVILALYILHGPTPEFFSYLNGEFAFVIWDAQRQKLVAARDRFGIKPLFWYYDSSRLVFASEIKAILSVDGIERRFGTEWLDHFSVLPTFPSYNSFAEGVFAVHPGKYLTMDLTHGSWDAPEYNTYWSALPLLRTPNTSISYEEAKKEVRRLLTEAVKRRLVADRKMCVYLSGGVDSTIVCGLVRSLGHPLTSITIGFGDHLLSEEDMAAKSAQHFSLKHERMHFTAEDTVRYTEKTIYHTEIAIINPHSVAKFCLSEFAHKKGFVVALTGEGADELLLGYSPFRLDALLEMRSRGEGVKSRQLMEDFNTKEIKGMSVMLGTLPMDTPKVRGTPCWMAWQTNNLYESTDALRAPYKDGHMLPTRSLDTFVPSEVEGLPSVKLSQVWWLTGLHNYVIPCLGDRMEMASSIEGRPPILDPKFADFVLRLPQDYLIDPDTLREKRILYEAFEDMLPPHILLRTKQPFLTPPWCDALFNTAEGHELVDKYLSREALERTGVWLPERVDSLIMDLRKGATQLDSFLGVILSVQILHALFIENPRLGDPDFPMVDKSPGDKVKHC